MKSVLVRRHLTIKTEDLRSFRGQNRTFSWTICCPNSRFFGWIFSWTHTTIHLSEIKWKYKSNPSKFTVKPIQTIKNVCSLNLLSIRLSCFGLFVYVNVQIIDIHSIPGSLNQNTEGSLSKIYYQPTPKWKRKKEERLPDLQTSEKISLNLKLLLGKKKEKRKRGPCKLFNSRP